MIQVLAIDHVVLRTTDVDRLVGFYSDILGCRVERTLPADTGLIQLRAGDALIDIVDVNSELGRRGGRAPGEEGHNLDHFCLRIGPVDEDELIAWLKARGIEAGPMETRYGADGFGPSLYLEDPDGNVVELRPQSR